MMVVSGSGYILSADLAAHVARSSQRPSARVWRLEDVTVAAALRGAPGYGGQPRHDNRVRHLGKCTDDALVLHYQSAGAMRSAEAALRAAGCVGWVGLGLGCGGGWGAGSAQG